MTFPRRVRRSLSLAGAIAVVVACAGPRLAAAAQDDFEFGQKLASKGMFDFARRVYDRMLKDPALAKIDKDRAKYGLALLGREEARTFAGRPDAAWGEIKVKYDDAAKSIQEFINANAGDAKVDQAKLELGGLNLQIVTWINDQLNPDESDPAERDAKVASFLKKRQVTKETLYADAQGYVEKASALFDDVQRTAKSAEDKEFGAYNFATAQYFRGLVYASCSAPALSAFAGSLKTLEDYATANDTHLTGSYAEDFLGLSEWEVAKCQTDPKERTNHYDKAKMWFEAVTAVENATLEHLKLIMRGYYHLAQMSFEAGRQQDHDFWKTGSAELKKMEKVGQAMKVPVGCRAFVEWGKIEAARKNFGDAIRLARSASDAAKAGGFTDEERLANKVLTEIVQAQGSSGGGSTGGSASSGAGVDPGVLMKIAENLYQNGKYAEAVRAFQQAVAATPRTTDGTIKYYLPAWSRIGTCYERQGLLVEAALSYEAIVEEYVAGRIPKAASSTSDIDPNFKAVLDAANAERRIWQQVLEKTGDAAFRTRGDRIANFIITDPEMGRLNSLQGSDLAYSQALTAFNEGVRSKGANSSGWKDALTKAKGLFEEASKNFKSERQDNAWVYLVRVQDEMDQPAAAVSAADAAFQFWETAAAKKKEADVPGITESRKNCKAQVTYYKAKALHDLKRDDEALAVLKGYATTYPKADPAVYKQLAMGLEIRCLLAKDRVVEADALTTKLITDYPDYFMLSQIVFTLARYYEDQAKAIEAKVVPIDLELYGTAEDRASGLLSKIKAATAAEATLAGNIADQNNEIVRLKRIVANSKEPPEVQAAQEKLDKMLPDIAGKQVELEKMRANSAELTKHAEELQVQRKAVRAELVEPYAKAADKYWLWDKAVQDADTKGGTKKRTADNVRQFASQYYRLAKLKPDEPTYWDRSRSLFTDYLAFPEVAEWQATDERKRPHLGRLGEVEYHLAEATKDPKQARVYFEQSVEHLQSVLAKLAVNTSLVVGHLSGEYVTLPWFYEPLNRTFKIPVPRAADVTTFKDYVKKMSGEQVPKFVDAGIDKRFTDDALPAFKKAIQDMGDASAKSTVESLRKGGFDPLFFAEFANTQKDFLLPLAHAYARSGTAANALKALNVTQALLLGSNKVEDDSSEWWEVKSIVLEVYVSSAERAIAESGPSSPETRYAKQADDMISTVKNLYPHIGGAERHDETLKEWLGFQERNRKSLASSGQKERPVDLAAEAPPPAPVAPPAPAPTPPAPDKPPEPAMGEGMN